MFSSQGVPASIFSLSLSLFSDVVDNSFWTSKSFDVKNFWRQKFLTSKIFDVKKFWRQKVLTSKNFWRQKSFDVRSMSPLHPFRIDASNFFFHWGGRGAKLPQQKFPKQCLHFGVLSVFIDWLVCRVASATLSPVGPSWPQLVPVGPWRAWQFPENSLWKLSQTIRHVLKHLS